MKVGTGSQLWFLMEPLRLELQPDLPALLLPVSALLMGCLAVAVAELVLEPAPLCLELRPVPVGELGLVGGGLGR